MHALRPLPLSALILVGALGACVTWEPTAVTPEAVLGQHPKAVRVTQVDGHRVVLEKPFMVIDSIVGKDPRVDHRRAVALTDVGSLESAHVDGAKSLLAVTAMLILFALSVAVYFGKDPGAGM